MVFTAKLPTDVAKARSIVAAKAIESVSAEAIFCFGGAAGVAQCVAASQRARPAADLHDDPGPPPELTVAAAAAFDGGAFRPSAVLDLPGLTD
eukprot:2705654-Prymnesium_polylepis.1